MQEAEKDSEFANAHLEGVWGRPNAGLTRVKLAGEKSNKGYKIILFKDEMPNFLGVAQDLYKKWKKSTTRLDANGQEVRVHSDARVKKLQDCIGGYLSRQSRSLGLRWGIIPRPNRNPKAPAAEDGGAAAAKKARKPYRERGGAPSPPKETPPVPADLLAVPTPREPPAPGNWTVPVLTELQPRHHLHLI
ncbi:Replication protein A 70 kDa DNA-binding subunit [Frankliniella fusca]|uniref:Replication protein A 70 kDa DNA-binding subunit n=1 Tax=Frankliniella fusca TaxID=407009 RepID=A0AAE1LTZ8_9NEOP|nr:Replication protein A 70 kDa DNA-binding subunit [Frankliniella fusca]